MGKLAQFWNISHENFSFLFSRPAVEILEGSADGKSSPADLHGFQHPRVPQLVQDHVGIVLVGLLLPAKEGKKEDREKLFIDPTQGKLHCSSREQ